MYVEDSRQRFQYICSATLLTFGIPLAIVFSILWFTVDSNDDFIAISIAGATISIVLIILGISLGYYARQKGASGMYQGNILSGSIPPELVASNPFQPEDLARAGYSDVSGQSGPFTSYPFAAPPPSAYPRPFGVYLQKGPQDIHSMTPSAPPPPSYDDVIK